MNSADNAALQARVEELIRQNEQILRENEMYESYLKRHVDDPESLCLEKETKRGRSRRSKKPKFDPNLNWKQRVQIVSSELEQVKSDVEQTKENSTKMVDTIAAVLEETDLRIAELKREAYEFKRDIVLGAENARTGKTAAEKVVRYMEDRLRQKDATVEKLRLKNSTLKNQLRKAQTQLKQKEEMGEALHYIDFHQLQIENKQYVAKIEERNQELLKLKLTTGNTVQLLNTKKSELAQKLQEAANLRKDISNRREMLEKVARDEESAWHVAERMARVGQTLKQQVEETSEMPSVMDYVKQKAEFETLEKDVKNWRRKVEIAEMAAQ